MSYLNQCYAIVGDNSSKHVNRNIEILGLERNRSQGARSSCWCHKAASGSPFSSNITYILGSH